MGTKFTWRNVQGVTDELWPRPQSALEEGNNSNTSAGVGVWVKEGSIIQIQIRPFLQGLRGLCEKRNSESGSATRSRDRREVGAKHGGSRPGMNPTPTDLPRVSAVARVVLLKGPQAHVSAPALLLLLLLLFVI